MEGIKNLIIDLGGVLINLTRNRCIEAFENLGVENIREQITNNYTMLLSNTNELHWKWSEDTYFSYQGLCPQDFFHKIYLSYELHMLKRNADIFEYVLKDSNLLAEETMLIDDASVNCRAAELLGMKSYMPQQREDWSHLFK